MLKRQTWEADSKHTEVSLKTRIDGETTSSRVHAGYILYIVNLLQCELVTIIPVVW